jgi:transcriptional regulator with XRE-family HTH domain
MSIVDRIKQLMHDSELSAAAFADIIGVQRSSISHILSERNKPSLDFILKILHAYPSVSSEWLLKGIDSKNTPTPGEIPR